MTCFLRGIQEHVLRPPLASPRGGYGHTAGPASESRLGVPDATSASDAVTASVSVISNRAHTDMLLYATVIVLTRH